MDGEGHLFVIHGDQIEVRADALLVPCDVDLNVSSFWSPLLGVTVRGPGGWVRPAGVRPPRDFSSATRAPVALPSVSDRKLWMVNTGGGGDIDWLMSGIDSALRHVTRHLDGSPLHNRERHLIALPVFGVGAGGYGQRRGQVIRTLLQTLGRAAARPGSPDIALVVNRRSDYAAVQSLRVEEQPDPTVAPLARRVREGGMVLFIGSGASAGAGLPTWDGLLDELAERAGLDGRLRDAARRLPAPDAADIISSNLPGGDVHGLVASMFRQSGVSLVHGLLASLRVPEAVTTNYDTLYENASRQPHDGRLKVLPRQRRVGDEPWLLKLHGDIDLDGSIVLTRDHYVRFDADSAPLASVVQSQMVTKHMLFVGYSLSDENFIRLARQVRQLFARTSRAPSTKVGTVLSLFRNPGREALWGEDLDFVAVTDSEDMTGLVASAARRLEIFLDQLAVASCDETSWVLDRRYADLLTDADRRLVDALEPLLQHTAAALDSPAWAKVRALLVELGWRPASV